MTIHEFTHGQHTYRAGKLPAMTQLHVTRRLAPFLSALMGSMPQEQARAMLKDAKEPGQDNAAEVGLAAMGPLLDAVAAMPDDQVDYVIKACLSVVERKESSGGWAPIMSSGGALMFEDLDMVALLNITRHVLQRDLAGFFGGSLQAFAAGGRT